MKSVYDRLFELENKIIRLQDRVMQLMNNKDFSNPPYSKVGTKSGTQSRVADISSGYGVFRGVSPVIWNNTELNHPLDGTQPADPDAGYNKHSHGEFSGGALDINTLKLVEYENTAGIILDSNGNPLNNESQQFWKTKPNVKKTDNGIEKIGLLDIQFDEISGKWIAGGGNYIDVDNSYLVQYVWTDADGNEVDPGTPGAIKTSTVKTDENGVEMIAPLRRYSSTDTNNQKNIANVVWDKDAKCFRFYAVFKPWFAS